MINALIDLEALLGRYDPARILVGPVLRLSRNSSSRYFFIAGKGTKVYQSIGLGAVGVEWNAQRQRADMIEKLRGRFAEVITFDSFIAMAHAAHRLWPNEETAAILGLVAGEAKSPAIQTAISDSNTDPDESSDNVRSAGVVSGGGDNVAIGESFVMGDNFVMGDGCAADRDALIDRDRFLTAPLPSSRAQTPPLSSHPASTLAPQDNTTASEPRIGAGTAPQVPPAEGTASSTPLIEDAPRLSLAEAVDAALSIEKDTKLAGEDSRRSTSLKRRAPKRSLADAVDTALSIEDETKLPAEDSGRSTSLSGDLKPSVAEAVDAALSIENETKLPGEDSGRSILLSGDVPKLSLAKALDWASSLENDTKRPGEDSGSATSSLGGDDPRLSLIESLNTALSIANEARLPADGTASSPSSTEIAVRPPEFPVKGARPRAATVLQLGIVGGVAGLVIGMMVYSGRQQVSDHAMPASVRAPLVAGNSDDDAAPAVVAGTLSAPANQIATATEPKTKVEPTPVSPVATAQIEAAPNDPPSPPPPGATAQIQATRSQSQSVPVASADANAVPVSTPRPPPRPVVGTPTPTVPSSALQSPAATRLTADAITRLVDRARDFLNNGDFAAARPLLQRAAEAGSATAALMMGRTFDPLVMHELGAVGIAPDIAQARLWYEKAAELGSDIAAQRLATLVQTHQ